METVKSTLFAESESKTQYFDVEEGISIFEKMSGKKIEGDAKEFMRDIAACINRAYQEGLRDGKEAAQG